MSKKSYIIGRAGDIALYDDTVSRRHARLDVDGDECFLTDLESRNGTYLIVDKQLLPFTKGRVSGDQVFAFGECVRTMTQLLDSLPEKQTPAVSAAETPAAAAPVVAEVTSFDATMASLPAVQRLTAVDIIGLLERAEDALNGGRSQIEVCETLGISEQRYQRWCREYGATRIEREGNTQALRRENERLRKLVSDLSLERDALREALEMARHRIRGEGSSPPSLSVVMGGDGKVKN
ncbi:MAG: FHA domain-containing protein [Gammaproteobacteria bacterium]|nr:FHA domain-containing protein [Gammaproteobacteria bacterium]